MALNTDFSSGQILTATAANNWPRGLVSVTTGAGSSASVSTETVILTSPSFTAVANRYYRITYWQPVLSYQSGTVNNVALNIRLTNLAGALQASSEVKMTSAGTATGVTTIVKTLTAGATVFVATFAPSGGGNVIASGSSPYAAQLVIEDIGSV